MKKFKIEVEVKISDSIADDGFDFNKNTREVLKEKIESMFGAFPYWSYNVEIKKIKKIDLKENTYVEI